MNLSRDSIRPVQLRLRVAYKQQRHMSSIFNAYHQCIQAIQRRREILRMPWNGMDSINMGQQTAKLGRGSG